MTGGLTADEKRAYLRERGWRQDFGRELRSGRRLEGWEHDRYRPILLTLAEAYRRQLAHERSLRPAERASTLGAA